MTGIQSSLPRGQRTENRNRGSERMAAQPDADGERGASSFRPATRPGDDASRNSARQRALREYAPGHGHDSRGGVGSRGCSRSCGTGLSAGRMGTVVPLAELQGRFRPCQCWRRDRLACKPSLTEAFQQVAGLEPAVFPGWLAAGLSALGEWINTATALACVVDCLRAGGAADREAFGRDHDVAAVLHVDQFRVLAAYADGAAADSVPGDVGRTGGADLGHRGVCGGCSFCHALSFGMSLLCTILPGAT